MSRSGVARLLLRTLLASVGCSLLLVTSTVSADAADAAGPIQPGKFNDNSPASDNATNASVKGEYVIIKNFPSGAAIDYCAWTSNGPGDKYC